MQKFVAGFAVASVLWGSGLGLYFALRPTSDSGPALAALGDGDAGVETAGPADPTNKRRRRRRSPGEPAGSEGPGYVASPTGNAVFGDDLGEDDARSLDLGGQGGEEQLTDAEVERGMDQAFGRIRRCFMLAAGDDPVSGRLTVGLRIEGSGAVSRVNLDGPAAVTTGEAASCLRGAVQSVRFRSFNGPAMVVRYPITIE